MSSRTCVIGVPEMTVLSTLASACELRPSSRASSWSMRMRTCARRLDPVEIDVLGLRIAGDDLRRASSAISRTLRDLGPADAILHRPADRRPELQRIDAGDDARELLGQQPSRAWPAAARAPATSLATITAWEKKSFGSCTLSGR